MCSRWRLLQGAQEGRQVLGEVESRMGDQAAVVVDKSDQIGFSSPALNHHLGSVHHIRLPDVVGQLGFELAPIDRRRFG